MAKQIYYVVEREHSTGEWSIEASYNTRATAERALPSLTRYLRGQLRISPKTGQREPDSRDTKYAV